MHFFKSIVTVLLSEFRNLELEHWLDFSFHPLTFSYSLDFSSRLFSRITARRTQSARYIYMTINPNPLNVFLAQHSPNFHWSTLTAATSATFSCLKNPTFQVNCSVKSTTVSKIYT